jgi:NitT/TauT family transport system substrate-binding protein
MPLIQTRRRLLTTLALGSVAAGILPSRSAKAIEPPLETTSVRIAQYPFLCYAPQFVADDLLRAEGFTDIAYKDGNFNEDVVTVSRELGEGKFDFAICLAMHFIVGIDQGQPISVVSGVHAGCFELFAREGIHSVADLKGKTVGISIANELLMAMVSYVGLDPRKDLTLIDDYNAKPLEQFAQGKIDAFMGIAPEPQILRARGVGHVILRTAVDEPWSQYYCCMLAVNRDYLKKHPVATKRVIRALLKAADVCTREPERAARQIVDRGYFDNYDIARQTINELPYSRWRDYDARDSVRFYALRLHELGMIKTNPRRIAEEGTEPRFLDELKRELKA